MIDFGVRCFCRSSVSDFVVFAVSSKRRSLLQVSIHIEYHGLVFSVLFLAVLGRLVIWGFGGFLAPLRLGLILCYLVGRRSVCA